LAGVKSFLLRPLSIARPSATIDRLSLGVLP
jgi:hypothetical protein